MAEVIKSYKGFNKDMTCRGFQFEEGKEYEEDGADVCNKGFHACEMPLDVFKYYPPASSVYHEVEQSGEISKSDDDSKVASSKIKIGAEVDIPGLVKAQIEFVKKRTTSVSSNTGDWAVSSNTGDRAVSSNTGNRAVSSNTGDGAVSSNTGNRAVSSNTGDWAVSSNTGDGAVSSNTGDRAVSSNTGDRAVSSNTGDGAVSSNTGYGAVNVSTGCNCTNSGGEATLCAGWGKNNKCKGVIGSYIVLSEWGDWDGAKYPLLTATMICVDGKKYKADTWYTFKDGKVVEWEEE